MNQYPDGSTACGDVREDLAEVALGIVSGRRRSQVLEHVEGCARCRAELEQLSSVADSLIEFSAEVEPPIGFELRLAERLRDGAASPRPTRARRAGVWALAAVLVVVVGIGVGSFVTGPSNDPVAPSSSNLATATLFANGRAVGELFVSAGRPAWMFMTIDDGSWSGAVTCEVVLANGQVETTGRFQLASGYGAWGAPLSASAGEVRGARLVTATGAVYASAMFPV